MGGGRGSLWVRVIKSRYGEEAGDKVSMGMDGGVRACRGGGWWQKVKVVVRGSWGDWFFPLLTRRIGDGRGTNFWNEPWGGSAPLRSRFPRLYHLSANQMETIKDMGVWYMEKWRWVLVWRQMPAGQDADKVQQLISWIGSERWQRGDATHQAVTTDPFVHLWASMAPFKQKVVGWRVLRDRLPTRDNLIRRLIIPSNADSCPCCNETAETFENLLLRCGMMERLLREAVGWVGASWATLKDLGTHFVCFINLCKGKRRRKVLGALWICVVWVIVNGEMLLFFRI